MQYELKKESLFPEPWKVWLGGEWGQFNLLSPILRKLSLNTHLNWHRSENCLMRKSKEQAIPWLLTSSLKEKKLTSPWPAPWARWTVSGQDSALSKMTESHNLPGKLWGIRKWPGHAPTLSSPSTCPKSVTQPKMYQARGHKNECRAHRVTTSQEYFLLCQFCSRRVQKKSELFYGHRNDNYYVYKMPYVDALCLQN